MNDSAKAGAGTTILTFILGSIMPLDKSLQDEITFWLQASAFLITIIVGLLTIYITIKKIRRNEKST